MPGHEVHVTLPHGACSERETAAEDKVGEGGDVLGGRELPACGDTGDSSVCPHALGHVRAAAQSWKPLRKAREEETGRVPVTILTSQAVCLFLSSYTCLEFLLGKK